MSGELHREIGRAASAGYEASGFFASIMAGFFLGMLADSLLETRPVFIVIGIVAGSVIGFWRMWTLATRETDT